MTTRLGGVSGGAWAALNLATHVGDDPAAVAANRARLAAALELPGAPRWLTQVHGTHCVDAATIPAPVEADASHAHTPGVVCAVLTADCLPILLCDRDARCVAAVHAGWRGLHDGVIAAAIDGLGVPAGRLCAWIGPGIGVDAYVVGEDLRERFVAREPALAACFERRGGDWHADLSAIARRQLDAAGVGAVAASGLCTFTDPRFYSYRRDGLTGRFASLIWLS
ncbi:MAG: peptidoglycan editing factor PgeF [Gammaproteobacteria bacterium]